MTEGDEEENTECKNKAKWDNIRVCYQFTALSMFHVVEK